jgi:small subunit ribosomal protein S33
MSWYHRPIGKDLDPLFVDPDVERKKLKIERLARRGKVTPKKGEGKRAKKK